MSSRCHSRLTGTADTVSGPHRSPITSEKSWLDFAVRELSRVAAGKAQGQEAVWKHKPAWWDGESQGLTWKNPTTNPKDCKANLKKKLERLVKHLRQEQLIPSELEEEIRLWEAGRMDEIFLITTCSSALGHFNSLNLLLKEICRRSAESKISIPPRFLCNLKQCFAKCRSLITSIKSVQDSGSSNQTTLISGVPNPTFITNHEENAPPPAKRARIIPHTRSSSSCPAVFSDPTSKTTAPVTSVSRSDPSTELDSDFEHAGHSLDVTTPVSQQIHIHNKTELAATQHRPQVSTGVKCKRVPSSSLSTPTKRSKARKPIATDVTAAPSGSVGQLVRESASPSAVVPKAAAAALASSGSLSSPPRTSSTVAAAALALLSIVTSPSSSSSPPSAVAAAAASLASLSPSASLSSSFNTPFGMKTNDPDTSSVQELYKLIRYVTADTLVDAHEYSQDTTLIISKFLDVGIGLAKRYNMTLSDLPLASAESSETSFSQLMNYILSSDSSETAAGCEGAFSRLIEESGLENDVSNV